MSIPYRQQADQPLVEYPLRTLWWPVITAASVILALLGCVALFSAKLSTRMYTEGLILLALAGLIGLAVRAMPEFVVSGESPRIKIYRDRVELPQAWNSEPLVLPWSAVGIRGEHTRTRTYVMGIPVDSEVLRLVFETPSLKRVLVHHLFSSLQQASAALLDLQSVAQGLPAPSTQKPAPAVKATESDYDARIDEELERLDE